MRTGHPPASPARRAHSPRLPLQDLSLRSSLISFRVLLFRLLLHPLQRSENARAEGTGFLNEEHNRLPEDPDEEFRILPVLPN